jgi:hypothetical protein
MKVTKDKALKAAAFVAVFGITGVVAYAASRVYKSYKGLDEIDLDFGNDAGLSSMIGKRDE